MSVTRQQQARVSNARPPTLPARLASAVARVVATLAGRDYVIPEDVQELAREVLAHRLLPTVEAQVARRDPGDIVSEVISATRLPERG